MVLILPKVETFGEKFGAAIGKGGAEGLEKGMESKRKIEELRQENKEIEAATGIKMPNLTDPEMRKIWLSEKLKGKNEENQIAQKLKGDQRSESDKKREFEELEMKRVKDTGQKAFNGLVGLLKKNNVGLGSGAWSAIPGYGETAQDVGEFTSLTGGLESMLVDMVSRGTLSNTRFNYIKNDLLPKAGDRQSTIRGKLKGLAEILELDPSELLGNENTPAGVSSGNTEKPPFSKYYR